MDLNMRLAACTCLILGLCLSQGMSAPAAGFQESDEASSNNQAVDKKSFGRWRNAHYGGGGSSNGRMLFRDMFDDMPNGSMEKRVLHRVGNTGYRNSAPRDYRELLRLWQQTYQ